MLQRCKHYKACYSQGSAHSETNIAQLNKGGVGTIPTSHPLHVVSILPLFYIFSLAKYGILLHKIAQGRAAMGRAARRCKTTATDNISSAWTLVHLGTRVDEEEVLYREVELTGDPAGPQARSCISLEHRKISGCLPGNWTLPVSVATTHPATGPAKTQRSVPPRTAAESCC